MKNQSDDKSNFTIRIPWDSNTFRGFVASLVLISAIIFWGPSWDFRPDRIERPTSTTIPLTVLNSFHFGDGDGSGANPGNLQAEGTKVKGKQISQLLEDASAPKHANVNRKTTTTSQLELSTRLIPTTKNLDKKEDREKKKTTDNENTTKSHNSVPDNSSSIAKGETNGSDNGTGRGNTGTGTGKGVGYELDWGGGGATMPVYKPLPKCPPGLNQKTIVKLKFTISPDGDVSFVLPLTRGVPLAENSVKDAFRQWKFKPPKSDVPLTGTITFRFDIN